MVSPGAALAALRGRHWHQCQSCGKRFSGIKTAKFCSNACRQAAKYAKQKDRQMTPNMEAARNYEQKAARWLYEANVAREAGKKDRAEKLYAKSQYWHDKMNKALGNG